MPDRPQTLIPALTGVLLLAGCDASYTDARTAYEDARAALAAGEVDRAEAVAEEAAERGGAAFGPYRDFIAGNVAFARCEQAARQAAAAGAEPFAWQVAIDRAERAAEAWSRAAASRADWPAARRNVERALRRLEALRRSREQAGAGDRRKERGGKGPPRVIPPTPGAGDPAEPTADAAADGPQQDGDPARDPGAQRAELPAERVLGLLDALAEKEKLKLAGRKAQRRRRPGVEQDW